MNHCVFCSTEFSDEYRVCPHCREYKGIVDGPLPEEAPDEKDLTQ